ncbi:RNA-directed DNA polymerase from mobile element jockey [Eumeta japonica]|uniref:RNA-directed DNA polymerase from mobile element jockey n=1 Tax=Eumeta variegata TaxID=151549 RepID=A0A4C1YYM9_EUMVA|nr:RNA-directed DNA polymerase from mobile element jockey [Eumeta japonica]
MTREPALLIERKRQVVRGVTSSDHNAVTFEIRTGGRPGPGPSAYTSLQYSKGSVVEFLLAFDNAKQERALTAEMVESVDSCDQPDGAELYTECVRCACDAAIPPKRSTRKVNSPGGVPSSRAGKGCKHQKRRIRNAAPADAHTWSRNMESQGGSSGTLGKLGGRSIEGRLRKGLQPDESAALLAKPFSLVTRWTPMVRTMEIRRRTDGIGCPPEALMSCRVDPPLPSRDLGLFLAVANKCLRLGYSTAWKVAAIKVIPKPGKDDYSRPKSYRPIGLLSVMGKTVERMLVCRIKWHIMPKLQARQYGFMPQRGTEDSLYDLMTHIYNELSLKKIILMVSLDIEGAFDNAWWPAIRNQLLAHKCPVNLYGMASIAGPTFGISSWTPTPRTRDPGVYVQAFADDVVLMFSGQSASVLEAEANRALARERLGRSEQVEVCTIQNKRDGAYQKLKFDVPTMRMGHDNCSG